MPPKKKRKWKRRKTTPVPAAAPAPPKDFRIPGLRECEDAIGLKAMNWHGRCAEVAHGVNRALKLGWREQYGFYHGPVAPGGFFDAARPFHRHGWLLMPDGRVFDPTRWVFESAKPYIYCGPEGDEYDNGMERFKEMHRSDPPEAKGGAKILNCALADPDAALKVTEYFENYPDLTFDQIHWLGNVGPRELGRHAAAIYAKIIELGHQACIPLDYRVAVLRGGKYG